MTRNAFLPLALLWGTLLALALGGCRANTQTASTGPQSTLDALVTEVSAQSTELARHLEYISYLATLAPRPSGAPVGPTQVPSSVAGSLTINDGACCISGIAGEPLRLHVAFQAVGTAANISEMRFGTGLAVPSSADFEQKAWGLFVPTMQFDFTPPLGWTTLYVTVQYRDVIGNVSAIYSDDISVEGFPPPPTSSP